MKQERRKAGKERKREREFSLRTRGRCAVFQLTWTPFIKETTVLVKMKHNFLEGRCRRPYGRSSFPQLYTFLLQLH